MPKTLIKLSHDKTVVFSSPIEGDDVLVRTGVISGALNFIHSVLTAYSKEYSNMPKKERIKFAQN